MSNPETDKITGFFEALLGGAGAPTEEPSVPTPEEQAEATAVVGSLVQDLVAIAIGVRTRAIEGGISPQGADAMALSTFSLALQGVFGGANG